MAKITVEYVDGWPMAEPLGKKEAALLSQLLIQGEKVIGIVIGSFDQAVVATDHKVCVLKTGLMSGQMFGGKSTAFDYRNIVGVEIRTGFAQGEFELLSGGLLNNQGNSTRAKVKIAESPNGLVFDKKEAAHFNAMASKIREKAGGVSNHTAVVQAASHPSIDAIKKLAELHAAGILTDDEFASKKTELLAKM
jgi:hypothetical protein